MVTFSEATRFPRRLTWAVANRLGILGAPSVGTSPGLDDEALARWRSAVSKGGVYLEYGSGGSTVAALRHASAVVSVETDEKYLRAVQDKISETMVETPFYPIHVDIGWTEKWGRPLFRRPSKRRAERWRRYTSAPWEVLSDAGLVPDFIFVDGRFRAASVMESLLRLPADSDCLFMLDDFGGRQEGYDVILPFVTEVDRAGRALLFRRASTFDPDECARLLKQFQADPR